ncbi:MAG: rhodanese-like domain-containing protein [Chloroflexi bacterium]|nr:rhodanese-like domain-containing protein [Chloroflexota bacterium]
MKRATLILAAVLLGVVALSACGQASKADPSRQQVRVVNVQGGKYADITPPMLKSLLDNKNFLFVNVHVPYDGEISKTDAFLPYDKIGQDVSKLPRNKGDRIVIYCRSGSMSTAAAKTLVSLGYTDVVNLDGGMIAWEKQGYELIRKPQ